ncbi:MAG: methyltransferase domain-containing protein [Propionibacteriaceae bacterium]
MVTWDPHKYLAFADERGRPFNDLIARVLNPPSTIVDLGCGPGQLSSVLLDRWPAASVLGVDSSPEMIDRANRDDVDPRTSYLLADVSSWRPDAPVDLIVSNAVFQWVPDQLTVIPQLREHVSADGTLAFGVPNNFSGPSHTLLRELAGREPYAGQLRDELRAEGTDAQTYLRLLADPAWSLDVWTTTYCHILSGPDAVFSWMSGTGARPVLDALPEGLLARFSAEYADALNQAYPQRDFGTVLPFERVFVVARRR